ncbi:nuclear transport factor 2 family protein [Amycolatopsis sp. NPDC005961]|uniref:YybH family protein n=1 Tax=Amycolatopsis sp. NPDC005961 TaxID=3156720 RepID=UPI0033F6E2B8
MPAPAEEFLADVLPRQTAAERAVHNGDAGASGDLAYTVGFEQNTVSINGWPATYTLRVTHVYRREDGEWRIVHRHGDRPPDEPAPEDSLHSR